MTCLSAHVLAECNTFISSLATCAQRMVASSVQVLSRNVVNAGGTDNDDNSFWNLSMQLSMPSCCFA